LPWLFFIRRALGERCWHNPEPKASLIIDDPLLKPHYGYLSFEALVEAMRGSNFATTIAFIPWNYARSSTSTSNLFKHNSSRLSLCVHGCDHTSGEFSSTDMDILRQQARIALERMELHERTAGVGWDPVMVFPQGIFSSASLRALQKEGYLAAVNSGLVSVDRPKAVRVGELLQMASNTYGGVPLFLRHYPTDILPFALDLFVGKQALIVEHHTYFRSGYHRARDFAAILKALEPRLMWTPLGRALSTAVQRRLTDSGIELRAYTDRAVFRNAEADSERSKALKLVEQESDPESVCGVKVNGRQVEYQLTDDRVEIQVDAAACAEWRVNVLRRPQELCKAAAPGLAYVAKVAMRRYLSELRDNAAAKTSLLPILQRLAPVARHLIRTAR
jgi:hypothetical protein